MYSIEPIGYVHTKYREKFGIPRQSGLVESPGIITFLPPYDDANAFRGLEEYDYIWVLWLCTEFMDSDGQIEWRPTVRPPRLGGNERRGVFATRSPVHPNGIGMSCVKLESVGPEGLRVSGVDMMDGTPVIDIKPYVSFADSYPDARSSFAGNAEDERLKVLVVDGAIEGLGELPEDFAPVLHEIKQIIALNPKPRYQEDSERIYGLSYGDYEIKFSIDGDKATIRSIQSASSDPEFL